MTYAVDVDAILRNVPLELKQRPQWVVWRYETREGKPTKVPYNPSTGERAKSTDASTWVEFQDALTGVASNPQLDGVGYVLAADDPYCGVDLDRAVDGLGIASELAQEICDGLGSYTETSPSGAGLRIFVRGTLPPGRNKDQSLGVEMYTAGRFLTVTGERFDAYPREIAERTAELAQIHARLFTADERPDVMDAGPAESPPMSDEEVLELCRAAANAQKFDLLWDGDAIGAYSSDSEADLALASMLSFYTQDVIQLDRLMRASGLTRNKWDTNRAYLQRTIAKALQDRTSENTYGGPAVELVVPRATVAPEAHEDKQSAPVATDAPERKPMGAQSSRGLFNDGFPLDLLPLALQEWVRGAAPVIGCPPAILATFSLGACSAAIGATHRLTIKKTWEELPALWVAVVAEPGSKKTPALKAAMRPLRDRQRALMADFKAELRTYESAMANRRLMSKQEREERPEPSMPRAGHIVANDTTIESLIGILESTPRGIVLDQDELVGWINALNQYKGGKGSDRQHYLAMWSSSEIKVDRKTIPVPVYVTRPFLAIVGGIQPEVVDQIQGGRGSDGLFERILWCWPPDMPPTGWSERDVDDATESDYHGLIDALLGREMSTPNGIDPEPIAVRFGSAARALWGCRVEDSERNAFESKEHKNLLSKMPAMAARLALVDHVVRQASHEIDAGEVQPISVESAWGLAEYFATQGARVLGYAGATESERQADKVLQWIKENGGEATIREVMRAKVGPKKASDIKAKFAELADMGLGTVVVKPVAGGKQVAFQAA